MYKSYCAQDYFPDSGSCSKYCKGRDDYTGHYTCNENGDKTCLPGKYILLLNKLIIISILQP